LEKLYEFQTRAIAGQRNSSFNPHRYLQSHHRKIQIYKKPLFNILDQSIRLCTEHREQHFLAWFRRNGYSSSALKITPAK